METIIEIFGKTVLTSFLGVFAVIVLIYLIIRLTIFKHIYIFSTQVVLGIYLAFGISIDKTFINFSQSWQTAMLIGFSIAVGFLSLELYSRLKEKK